MGPNDKVALSVSMRLAYCPSPPNWTFKLRQISITELSHHCFLEYYQPTWQDCKFTSITIVNLIEKDTWLCEHEWVIPVQLFGNLTILVCLAISFQIGQYFFTGYHHSTEFSQQLLGCAKKSKIKLNVIESISCATNSFRANDHSVYSGQFVKQSLAM